MLQKFSKDVRRLPITGEEISPSLDLFPLARIHHFCVASVAAV